MSHIIWTPFDQCAIIQSVQVSFVDLSVTQPQIAIWLADEPDTILDCFNMVHSYC